MSFGARKGHLLPMTNAKLRSALFVITCATSVLTLRGSGTPYRAGLSADLLSHLTHRTSVRHRVIVPGDPAHIDAIAAQHHLTVVRHLGAGAVVLADSDEIDDLANRS